MLDQRLQGLWQLSKQLLFWHMLYHQALPAVRFLLYAAGVSHRA
jgi:hypothetical protein